MSLGRPVVSAEPRGKLSFHHRLGVLHDLV